VSQYGGQWLGLWPGVWIGDGDSPVVGANLVLRWNVESGTAAVSGDFSTQWNITGIAAADYTVSYRIEGRIPESLIGGGGPDEEWIHPRVREYLKKIEEDVRAARYVPLKVETNTPPAGSTHRELAQVQLPAVAEIDESDLEEIEDLLMLID
jgi:hypothetical protein